LRHAAAAAVDTDFRLEKLAQHCYYYYDDDDYYYSS
jgi:hypothetical protein